MKWFIKFNDKLIEILNSKFFKKNCLSMCLQGHLILKQGSQKEVSPYCISIHIAGPRFQALFIWILLLVLAFHTPKMKVNIQLETWKQLLIHILFFLRWDLTFVYVVIIIFFINQYFIIIIFFENSGLGCIQSFSAIHFMSLESLMLVFTCLLLPLKYSKVLSFSIHISNLIVDWKNISIRPDSIMV